MRISLFLLFLITAWGMPGRIGATDERGTITLEAVTFNIRNGKAKDGPNRWEKRRDRVIAHLREMKADFYGLQEAYLFQVDAVDEGLPGYNWIGAGRGDHVDGGEYSPIFYNAGRFRPDPREQGTFWLSDTSERPGSITWGNACTRICTFGRFVHIGSGRGVHVFNTHLDHRSQPSREKSIDLILRRIGRRDCPDEPCILMGDLNADEENRVYAMIMNGAPPLRFVDPYRIEHPDETRVATFNGFRPGGEKRTGGKIDHIFLSAGRFAVEEAAIVTHRPGSAFISDHYAVTATARLLPPTRPVGPPRIHSHNDYDRPRPLHDALAYGAGSIEADVHLRDGELYVAHDEEEIAKERTLAALYLEPLAALVAERGGRIYDDASSPLLLHVDLKTEGETIRVLHRELSRHPDLFERYTSAGEVLPGPVRVIVWNRYREALGAQATRFVNFIAKPDAIGIAAGPADLDGHHARWGSLFEWRGEGPFPEEEKARLHALVSAIHEKGRTVRFWAIPRKREVYLELARAGVDFINSDDLAFAYDFVVVDWPRSGR